MAQDNPRQFSTTSRQSSLEYSAGRSTQAMSGLHRKTVCQLLTKQQAHVGDQRRISAPRLCRIAGPTHRASVRAVLSAGGSGPPHLAPPSSAEAAAAWRPQSTRRRHRGLRGCRDARRERLYAGDSRSNDRPRVSMQHHKTSTFVAERRPVARPRHVGGNRSASLALYLADGSRRSEIARRSSPSR